MDNQKQQKYLAALLSDNRVSPVLPPNSKGPICTPSPTNKYLTYNNQFFEISDPNNFKPLDPEAFHFFTPKFFDGVHRSQRPSQQFHDLNVVESARKACSSFAHHIRDFVMGLSLTDEQRRLAFWTSLSLEGLRDMVVSYGLSTESSNIGLFIAANVSRFLQRARDTKKLKGRPADVQRAAVNTIWGGCVSTPERQPDSLLKNLNNAVSTRK